MEIAVVGNSEFILGFRLAGIQKTYAADTDEAFADQVTKVLGDKDVGIIVLKGEDMQKLSFRLRTTLSESVKPTVITIGEETGGISMRERIKRSVGVDLWK
ncbi:V/A-type H+-transporting ATPase subunit F [Methanomicrobium sp. W14]|jgi:V/A-type H+-transporting ATPase subunit F|uniref:V-type ATP synthase subunit F n=1 Tax=Methanomicrobium sp. W14 TaxID=2817839 RepID=UPI001AE55E7E|nr:V-type ATP synthase subunit F [Methanomicrobium sp. W14]MBP2133586.1 V/A-type H+-transporting ATPase subunit F [Methanomicrobium sp. W14]